MPFEIRKVVTGHDDDGRSTVIEDTRVSADRHRAGESEKAIWVTTGFPVDNDDATDASTTERDTSENDGTVFRVIRYEPGVAARHHRTNSIDYAVVLSGSIDMELDTQTITLYAGDTLVQRGTIHNWIDEGPEPCVIAFALIGAKPATVGGRPLPPTG